MFPTSSSWFANFRCQTACCYGKNYLPLTLGVLCFERQSNTLKYKVRAPHPLCHASSGARPRSSGRPHQTGPYHFSVLLLVPIPSVSLTYAHTPKRARKLTHRFVQALSDYTYFRWQYAFKAELVCVVLSPTIVSPASCILHLGKFQITIFSSQCFPPRSPHTLPSDHYVLV